MTKRLPQATKCPSFYWYWPNTCVRLSNVLDESGPDGPTSMWFYNNLLFGQTTNNGERNRVLPFGDWKIDLELPNSMENNAITISFPKEDLCLSCALIKSEDLVIFRMNKTCHSKYLERWHRFCSISRPGEREQKLWNPFAFVFQRFADEAILHGRKTWLQILFDLSLFVCAAVPIVIFSSLTPLQNM